jgi:rhodanese-related sulfurtransferase
MLKRIIAVLLMLLVATAAAAANYQYVSAEMFKEWQEKGKGTVIVDIQVPAEFAKQHFKGALETNAYPVKSDEERQRLDATLAQINASTDDVVIVCPRGGGGAKNTYDYLKGKGVEEKRLFILEKGMEGWPHPEMCVTGR